MVQVEHEAIVKKRENPNSRLTWEEYRSMTFTQMVVNETLRISNIPPGLFRKALKDFQVKGTLPDLNLKFLQSTVFKIVHFN